MVNPVLCTELCCDVPKHDAASRGRPGGPRARRMLTELDPAQRKLYDLFGLDVYAPKQLQVLRTYQETPAMFRVLTPDGAQVSCLPARDTVGEFRT